MYAKDMGNFSVFNVGEQNSINYGYLVTGWSCFFMPIILWDLVLILYTFSHCQCNPVKPKSTC